MTTGYSSTSVPVYGASHSVLNSHEQQPRKRKAENPSDSPPKRPKWCRVNDSSVPSWQHHPLSINGLIRRHCRDRLYVHPLQWTTQHLQLLECQFVRRHEIELVGGGRSQQQTSTPLLNEASVRTTINHLREPGLRNFKASEIRLLLELCSIQPNQSQLLFKFQQQSVATLPTSGIYSHPSKAPTIVYLDLDSIKRHRDQSIEALKRKGRVDRPGYRIKQKRRRQLQPSNEAEDPYIAAVLIALAQGQNMPVNPIGTEPGQAVSPGQSALGFQVHVFALASDAQTLHFYTTSIPPAWLQRLDEPSQRTVSTGLTREQDIKR
ncbi:hypothetical protein F5Y08DRAFT_337039 [Xylaria arbuscula]|nr:hypothetical protein F5Y08DRAFT_337039 [Xylaria arbuscula]